MWIKKVTNQKSDSNNVSRTGKMSWPVDTWGSICHDEVSLKLSKCSPTAVAEFRAWQRELRKTAEMVELGAEKMKLPTTEIRKAICRADFFFSFFFLQASLELSFGQVEFKRSAFVQMEISKSQINLDFMVYVYSEYVHLNVISRLMVFKHITIFW